MSATARRLYITTVHRRYISSGLSQLFLNVTQHKQGHLLPLKVKS